MESQRELKKIVHTVPKIYYDGSRDGRKDGRMKPPEMRKSFQISEMHAMHHEIARRLVIGQKPKEIAKALDVAYQTVINTKNSPVVKEQMSILSGARDSEVVDVAKQIRDLAPKAVGILEGIINNADETSNLQMKTSLAILDRAGHAVPKNVNVKGVHAVVSSADLAAIKERALEIGLDSGVIDIEPS